MCLFGIVLREGGRCLIGCGKVGGCKVPSGDAMSWLSLPTTAKVHGNVSRVDAAVVRLTRIVTPALGTAAGDRRSRVLIGGCLETPATFTQNVGGDAGHTADVNALRGLFFTTYLPTVNNDRHDPDFEAAICRLARGRLQPSFRLHEPHCRPLPVPASFVQGLPRMLMTSRHGRCE